MIIITDELFWPTQFSWYCIYIAQFIIVIKHTHEENI